MSRERTAKHGSASMYVYGCRCVLCVAAKAARDADYRARRKAELPGQRAAVVRAVVEREPFEGTP